MMNSQKETAQRMRIRILWVNIVIILYNFSLTFLKYFEICETIKTYSTSASTELFQAKEL